MPFLPFSNEQKKKQEDQNNINVSGSSGNTFTNQNNNSAPKPVSKSGSWTNLNSYLDANKDNAEMMSEKVTSDIDTKASDAQSGLNQLPGVDKISTVNYEKLNNDFYNNPNAKKDEYTSLKSSGGYNGPSDIYGVQGYQDVQNKTQQANTALDQSKTEDGRKTLLKSAYERPNYSLGMQNLDNLLVQNDPTSKAKFGNVQSKFSNLMGMLDDKTNNLNSNIDFNKQTALQNKNNIVAGEQQAKDSILNPINQRVNQMKQDVPLLQNRIKDDANDNILNDETLSQLGLSEGQSLYNLALNSYLTPQEASGINAGSVATKDEKAKFQALMNLIDGVDTLDTGAEEFKPLKFNRDQFNQDVAAKQAEYQNAYNNTDISGQIRDASFIGKAKTPAEIQQKLDYMKATAAQEPDFAYFWDYDIKQVENVLNNFNNQFGANRKVSKG